MRSPTSDVVVPSACLGGPPDLDAHIGLLTGMYPEEGWTPAATCTRCKHQLSAWDVLSGFSTSETDVTTCCPECQTRFPASLASAKVGIGPKPLICGGQLVYVLRSTDNLEGSSLRSLADRWPHVVASARFHYGSVARAFAAVGKTFRGETEHDLAAALKRIASDIDPEVIARHLGMEITEVARLIAA